MPFHNPQERSTIDLVPGVRARTFWGENMMLSLVDLDANAVIPSHHHPHEQVSYVLSGEMAFTVGEETRQVKAGDVVVIPGEAPHNVTVGPQPAQVLDVFSPPSEDMKY